MFIFMPARCLDAEQLVSPAGNSSVRAHRPCTLKLDNRVEATRKTARLTRSVILWSDPRDV